MLRVARAADMVAAMYDEPAQLRTLIWAQREFSAYGPSHWAMLVVFVIGAAALVWIGRRQTATQARILGRVLGALTAVIYGSVLVYSLRSPTIAGSVPLRLTDLATVAAAFALWSQRHWAFALTYYWGLVLSTQALISPVLVSPDFPHYQFLAFWAVHLLVVWAAIYLAWGRGMRPRWRSYRIAVFTTLVWAAVTFTFNSIAGTNYGFLNGKPANATLLDALGPWPLYLLTGGALVIIVWALMTWPWERKREAPAC
jgi:hypothetical integral membrane protein (TIGR02206 family)